MMSDGGKKSSKRKGGSTKSRMPMEEQGKNVFDYFSQYKDEGEQPIDVRDNSNKEIPIVPPEKPKSARKTSRGSKKDYTPKTSNVRDIIDVEPPKKKSAPKPQSAPKKPSAKKPSSRKSNTTVKEVMPEPLDVDAIIANTEAKIKNAAGKAQNMAKKYVTKSNIRKVGKAVGKGGDILKKGAKAIPKAIQYTDATLTGVGTAKDVTDLVKLKYEHDKITKYRAQYKESHPSDTGYLRFESWMERHYPEFTENFPGALERYDKHRTFPHGLPKYDSTDPHRRYMAGAKGDGYTPYPEVKGGPVTIKDLIAGTAIHAAKANRDGYHDMQKRFDKNAENIQRGRERGRADIPAVMANKHRGLPPANKTIPHLEGNRGGLKHAGEAAAGIKIGLRSTAPNLGKKPNVALGRKPAGGPAVHRGGVELGRQPTAGPEVRRQGVELGRKPEAGPEVHRQGVELGGYKAGNVLGEKKRPSYNIVKGRDKPQKNVIGEKKRPSYNIVKGRQKTPTKPSNPLGLIKVEGNRKFTGKKSSISFDKPVIRSRHDAPNFEAMSETFEEVTDVPRIEQIEQFINGDRPSMLTGQKDI